MKRICAWCGAKSADDGENTPDTHGICSDCAEKVRKQARKHVKLMTKKSRQKMGGKDA